MSGPSKEESESDYLLWQLTQQPFFILTAKYQLRIQRFQNFLMFFFLFLFSLSLFHLPLHFNLILSLPDFLSNILEENFHIDIVSRERCQKLDSQSLNLIANDSDILGETFI